ncbi:hypothetical protein PR202_ga30382 [Eleusine coracana subsp. coracana]|uniref:Uncharacterized protein n=1 Tax=Eleusine coracana subsp. coracana TaxID=191504 RepID=A0AAV5DQG7_ELECO|nr:hypothetical protein PR202_ga30382 [Eleusine coracana subsp. coracana]
MAVSAIGGWIASAGVAKLVDQVCCFAGDQYGYQRDDAKEKLRKLEESLWKIQAVVHKLESLHIKNPSMESWLGCIKDAVYQAEDVLDLFDYRDLEAKAEYMTNSWGSSTSGSSSSITSATIGTASSTSTTSSSTVSRQWENLCKSLQFSSKGSKIVLTTRSHKVANINGATTIMHLDGLKDEDYWEHFTQCAFGNATPADFPQLENIGKLLVSKLAGSPLAAKTVGGNLKLKLHEDHWRAVLGSKLWHIEQKEDDIIPALRFSYEHLSDNLKQYFVYFALFPKKCPHRSDVLIQMWRAQGYIEKETSDETAHEYIKELLQLSFIQKAASLDDHYVVHDLLHDFAELVSKGETLPYLDISGSRMFTEVPKSLFRLYHLQGLTLQFRYKDNKIKLGLQQGLSRLIQLRYLTAPSKIISGIEQIGRLTLLHALEEYHVQGDTRHSICQLKELNELQGKITIKNLENVRCNKESSEATLIKKLNLKKISLCWNHLQEVNTNNTDYEGVFEGLQPNCNLRELHVTGYMGIRSPTWLTREYLHNIQTIELASCHHWKTLPPFGSLPFLRILKMRHFKAVERIDAGFYGDATLIFPSLEEILFQNMDHWKEWPGVEANR